MRIFTIYEFNHLLRVDGKSGPLLMLQSYNDNIERGHTNPLIHKMLTNAHSVYCYSTQLPHYFGYKDREHGSGRIIYEKFKDIYNADSVIYQNKNVGKQCHLRTFLNVHYSLNDDSKYCEIPLAGLDDIELYFSALIGDD